MKKRISILFLALSALALVSSAARAGDMGVVPMPPPPPQPDFCFDQNLRSFDVYGGYRWVDTDDDFAEDTDGYVVGIGTNLFLNRYLGVGLEGAITDDETERFMVGANLLFRVPIDAICLAPYAFAGGGTFFGGDQGQWFTQVGLGLEYKANEFVSVFADGRFLYAEKDEDQAIARGGLRFSF
jgi:opacity protein-like surface antigen